jgi:predicted TIM-barrel fold metal-dependent hydrolase
LDFPVDTSRAIARLLYSNTFARTKDVRYIFSHAGGTIPYLATRFAIIDETSVIPGASQRESAAATFRRLYWDTALSWGDPVLHTLKAVVGRDQILFGTDYPYLRRDLAVSCRGVIEASEALTADDRAAIFAGNALGLFPRLKTARLSVEDKP